jgi:hypothetical protein
MNIVTQELLRRIKDRHLHEFVSHWDELEALVIGIYRANFAAEADHENYRRLKDWLSRRYPGWQAALRSHWQGVRIEGEIIQADPFLKILAIDDAGAFAGDWRAMQTLPAAREALNSLLISIIEGSTSI